MLDRYICRNASVSEEWRQIPIEHTEAVDFWDDILAFSKTHILSSARHNQQLVDNT